MRYRYYFFLIILFFLSKHGYSLSSDSLPETKSFRTTMNYFYERDFIYGNVSVIIPDTSIPRIHHVNPPLDRHYNYLGTPGSASMPQVYSNDPGLYTFTSTRSYDLLFLHSEDIRYYRTNKRYTEIRYHMGGFNEQSIQVLHTQNILTNWNAGLIFDRQGIKDYMNFSDTFRSRFGFWTWYTSPNKRYNAFAHVIWNTIKNGVNGGLSSDSLFDKTNVTNLGIKGLAYQIANAEQHARKRVFNVSQYYDVGYTERDSIGNITHRSPALRLHHEASYERKSFVYIDSDSDSSFYNDYFFGENTYDSLHSDDLKNRLAVQLPADTTYDIGFLKKFSPGIFAEYHYVKYGQRSDSTWDNLSAGANVSYKSDSNSFELLAEAAYAITGIDKGNYSLELKTFSSEYSFGRFGLDVRMSQSSPDLIFQWYESNNFLWRNSFTPVKNSIARIYYDLKKYSFRIKYSYSVNENYVYLNTIALPEQYRDRIVLNQLEIKKNFRFRYWHFDNIVTYQQVDRDGILHLPEWVTDQSFYYERPYFKNALLMALGVSANFNSTYYADAFMPANSLFYLQNTTKTGGYLRLDLFVNVQIKTANAFLRLENAADNLIENSYYLTPHYPMPGRVFKFGIVWRFLDQ